MESSAAGMRTRQQEVVDAYNERISELQAIIDDWQYRTSKHLTDHQLLELAGLDGARVLNVGCAYPIDEIMFAHRIDSWVASDLGEETIRVAELIARERLPEHLLARLSFDVADGTALPYEDASFDIAISLSTIDHVPDPVGRRRFVEEMARVVRPGGHVVITAPNRWHRAYARREQLGYGQRDVYEYCFSPRELKSMISDAGLEPLRLASDIEMPLRPHKLVRTRKPGSRPLLAGYNKLARSLGARMGWLARKPHRGD